MGSGGGRARGRDCDPGPGCVSLGVRALSELELPDCENEDVRLQNALCPFSQMKHPVSVGPALREAGS